MKNLFLTILATFAFATVTAQEKPANKKTRSKSEMTDQKIRSNSDSTRVVKVTDTADVLSPVTKQPRPKSERRNDSGRQ
ncbi:MAG: hypothetical protein EOO48_05365 [Flavobacterium sp.]|nr:MAG: hypothetical protein EOO48_05365 [Flavobacterium sp.]